MNFPHWGMNKVFFYYILFYNLAGSKLELAATKFWLSLESPSPHFYSYVAPSPSYDCPDHRLHDDGVSVYPFWAVPSQPQKGHHPFDCGRLRAQVIASIWDGVTESQIILTRHSNLDNTATSSRPSALFMPAQLRGPRNLCDTSSNLDPTESHHSHRKWLHLSLWSPHHLSPPWIPC